MFSTLLMWSMMFCPSASLCLSLFSPAVLESTWTNVIKCLCQKFVIFLWWHSMLGSLWTFYLLIYFGVVVFLLSFQQVIHITYFLVSTFASMYLIQWSDSCHILPPLICPVDTDIDAWYFLYSMSQWINLFSLHKLLHTHMTPETVSRKLSFTGLNMCGVFLSGMWTVFMLNFVVICEILCDIVCWSGKIATRNGFSFFCCLVFMIHSPVLSLFFSICSVWMHPIDIADHSRAFYTIQLPRIFKIPHCTSLQDLAWSIWLKASKLGLYADGMKAESQ
jgi:hypothetical protein